jgi:hypothetical protein
MNCAEHISAQVRWLAEEDRITRMQLVEIVEELLRPFLDKPDLRHFVAVNDKIHRLREVSDPQKNPP